MNTMKRIVCYNFSRVPPRIISYQSVKECFILNNYLSMPVVQRCRDFSTAAVTARDFEKGTLSTTPYDRARSFAEIPGPKGLPYIGTLLDYKASSKVDRIQDTIIENYKKYGRIYKETITGKTIVHVIDPDFVKQYYAQEDKLPSIPPLQETIQSYRKMRDFSPGLGNTNGEEWYRLRSGVQRMMMRPKEVVYILPHVNTIVDEFIQRITKLRNVMGEVSDFRNEVANWYLESAAMTCFDSRLGCLHDTGNMDAQDFIDSNIRAFQLSTRVKFSFPWHRIFTTPTWRKLVAVEDSIYRFSEKLVEETIAKIRELQEKTLLTEDKYNFISYLLSKENLSENDVKILTLSLLGDGMNTITPMAIYNLYCLATTPEVQEKLFLEVQSVIPGDKPVTEQSISKMPYLKACVKETFRFFPIGLDVSRLAKKDMVIGGYQIPKGTHVDMNNFVMARLQEYFIEPERYMPERWIRDGSANNVHPYIMIPFGHGPRMCVGRRFAEQDLYVLLSKFVRRFRVEWHHGKMDQTYRVLMIPDRPAQFSFVDRN